LLGAALGVQKNPSNTVSACYNKTLALASDLETLVTQFEDFSYTNYMAPIGTLATILVDQSNGYVACQGDTFMKQLKSRLSTFSGAFNVLFTVFYAILQGNISSNALYNSFKAVFDSKTCYDTGFALGQSVQGVLSVQVADNVYNNLVTAAT
jgi:hypothetical protein